MRLTRHAWIMSSILLVACAATTPLPPSRNLEAGDLKTLAGRWEGRGMTVDGRRFDWVWTVQPDGSFVTSSSRGEAEGRLVVRGGQVVVEGAAVDGVLTLHEGGGRRILKGPVNFKGLGTIGQSDVEVTQVR